jgi:esterase
MNSHSTVTLRAQLNGAPDKPAIILLHGLFGMSDNLGGLAKSLAERYTVYRLDLRNHGHSAWSDAMSLEEMAADIVAFCQTNHLTQIGLLGHSLGGKVAMQCALNHPDLVRGLIVADIAPVTYPAHHNQILDALLRVDVAKLESRQQADQQLVADIPELGIRQFLLKNLYRDAQNHFAWRMNLAVLSSQYDQLRLAPSGTAFNKPCLFIKGELSAYIQLKHTDEIKQLFPQATVKIIQGAGHFLHSEKPAAFNHIAGNFFDELFVNDDQT